MHSPNGYLARALTNLEEALIALAERSVHIDEPGRRVSQAAHGKPSDPYTVSRGPATCPFPGWSAGMLLTGAQ